MSGRTKLLDFLEKELVGPRYGKNEIHNETPLNRYLTGILFPQKVKAGEELEGEDLGGGDIEPVDDPVNLSSQLLPSSVGISFMTDSDKLSIKTYGASYESLDAEGGWARIEHGNGADPVIWVLETESFRDTIEKEVFQNACKIHVKKRELKRGNLFTVTLLNNKSSASGGKQTADCIFQVNLSCETHDRGIREYPSENVKFLDDEEQELELIYRKQKTYAIGHGCAATWDTEKMPVQKVAISFLPSYEIKPLTYDTPGNDNILEIAQLANEGKYNAELYDKFENFISNYEQWIEKLPDSNTDIDDELQDAKKRIVGNLEEAVSRAKKGLELIKNDSLVRKAFQFANLAMLIQMHNSKKINEGGKIKLGTANHDPVNYLKLQDYKWRPFQLAFLLITMDSLIDEESDFRDFVDLIWFPTGGGKTEAYLLAAATIIFYRRLKYKDGGAGTTVITRYTLRLLTVQQFERTSRLVCALEKIRRDNAEDFGDIPISIGMWVGMGTTPNNIKAAQDKLTDLFEQQYPENPFTLDSCPWCGTELVPEKRDDNPDTYGIKVDINSFKFYCPDKFCEYHNEIPVQIIDEELYKNPPTFLIGTIDKFARMAWDNRNGIFFGTDHLMPPSLIIQDELHLLSGPLGTISGLYESAIKSILEYKGHKPKIIASTATIRNASSQTTGLFGSKAKIFPPPGLDESDSYFMRKDKGRDGRLYTGVMSQSQSPSTSFIQTSAALLQGAKSLFQDGDLTYEEYSAYHTLVAYHNSLRELGKTITFARDDIPSRLEVISDETHDIRQLAPDDVVELTSNLSDIEIPEILSRLERGPKDNNPAGFVACTNMFSVGVDIQRLGLMVVHGQPKTTSEYIQSSSRVGRGKIPGLVVTHYSATKPRDRSHFESFLPYHSKIYRFVEPTSVTPFSTPARTRALHAALIIMTRHGIGLSDNNDAHKIRDHKVELEKLLDIYFKHAKRMDEKEIENTKSHMYRLIEEWEQKISLEGNRLVYSTNDYKDKGVPRLLYHFNEATRDGWKTLNSMRNIDEECKITVTGSQKT